MALSHGEREGRLSVNKSNKIGPGEGQDGRNAGLGEMPAWVHGLYIHTLYPYIIRPL